MELYVYRGEWGLPTIDYDCARVLAYLKFSEAKVTVNFNGNPFSSPDGMLPYLVTDTGRKIAGYTKIVEHLQSRGCDANAQLETQNFIVINGCIQYVFENLYPYFLYSLWGDPKNVDTTRMLYAKRIPIPFNFYCPRKYVLKTNELTRSLAGFCLEDSIELHDVADMLLSAKKCINWVAEKLGENQYLFGDTPSEIDAVLYGYFSVLLKLTLPNNALQNHLKQCTKLVRYVDRITTIYFAKEGFHSPAASTATSSSSSNGTSSKPKEEESESNGKPTQHDGTQKDEDTPYERKKRYVVSGIFATIAMVSYAFMSGILSLSDDHGGGGFFQYDEPEYDDED